MVEEEGFLLDVEAYPYYHVHNWVAFSGWLPLNVRQARSETSWRMTSVFRMSVKIELLRDFIVFHSQCNYLVQIISKGIQEVKEAYLLIFEDDDLLCTLYNSTLMWSQLMSSLASLLRDLMSAERLLQACRAKKWKRAAIVLSMPPPELEKYPGSSFLLLIRDFNWSLDVVRHALNYPCAAPWIAATLCPEEFMKMKSSGLSGDQRGKEWKFEWCPRRCRYTLQKNYVHTSERMVESHEDDDQSSSERDDEIRLATGARSHEDDVEQQDPDCKDVTGVAVDREESLQADFERQAQDRNNFLGIVEEHMTAPAYDSSFLPWLWQLCCNASLAGETPIATNKFLAVVKNRCQDTSDSGSTNLVSMCFEIDHLDLEMRNQIPKGEGASKRIFRANWLGLEVAVAIVETNSRDVIEKEAGFLVKVHHPNVVDFFGFALKEEALTAEEMASAEQIERNWTGYLVMELMQGDLRSLIEKALRGPRKQEYGGPFSLSITLDILLQIVGAMIHTHKFDILHRDLKAKNCLVSPKPVSSSESEGVSSQYYTVKLIDFGDSKLWSADSKQTLKKGTIRWMAPEVWQSSEYSKSADVYSFGMTCYEVVTGLIPFQGIRYRVMDKVLEGSRPTIPGTCPQSLVYLMKKCWKHKPQDRPTFEEIQKDLWAIKCSVHVRNYEYWRPAWSHEACLVGDDFTSAE